MKHKATHRSLEIAGDEPVFKTGLLLARDVAPAKVRRQLSRWVRMARVYQSSGNLMRALG
jgi:hypothetical protein